MTSTITRTPRTRAVLRTNYYQNPANANPVAGLHASANAYSVAGATGTYAIATGNFQQINATAIPAGGRFGYYIDVPLNSPAGVPVAAAIFFQTHTGPAPVRFWIDAYTAAGVMVGHSDVISSAATTTLNATVTPTDAITRLRYYVWLDNVTAAAMGASSVQVARYVVETGVTVAGAFFYGGQAAAGGLVYSWAGAVSNSASLQTGDNPADVVTPSVMVGYDMERPSQNTVIDVPGRPAPVVSLRAAGKRRGAITYALATEAAAAALDALLAQAAQFVVADTDRGIVGMTVALVPGGFRMALDDQTQDAFVATLQVVEQ